MNTALKYDPLITLLYGLSKEDSDRLKLLIQRMVFWTKAASEAHNKGPEGFLKCSNNVAEYQMEIGKLLTLAAVEQGFEHE